MKTKTKLNSATDVLSALEQELKIENKPNLESFLGFRLREWLHEAIEETLGNVESKARDEAEKEFSKDLDEYHDSEIIAQVKERCEFNDDFNNDIRDIVIQETDNIYNPENNMVTGMKMDWLKDNLNKITLEQLESLL